MLVKHLVSLCLVAATWLLAPSFEAAADERASPLIEDVVATTQRAYPQLPDSASCRANAARRPHPNFRSALLNIVTYASAQLRHDFGEHGCPGCELRLIEPRNLERYIELDDTGFEDALTRRIERLAADNQGAVLVLSGIPSQKGETTQTVALFATPNGPWSGFDGANSVLLANGHSLSCGVRTFGQKGSGLHCAFCAFGLCCGACKCTDCNNLQAARHELELPIGLDQLFDGPADFESYELNRNLLAP